MNRIQKGLAIGALGLTSILGGCDKINDTVSKVTGIETTPSQVYEQSNQDRKEHSDPLLTQAGKLLTGYENLISQRENGNGNQITMAANRDLKRAGYFARNVGDAAGNFARLVGELNYNRGNGGHIVSRSTVKEAATHGVNAVIQGQDLLNRKEVAFQLPIKTLESNKANLERSINNYMDGNITPEDRENLKQNIDLGTGIIGTSNNLGRPIPFQVVSGGYGRH